MKTPNLSKLSVSSKKLSDSFKKIAVVFTKAAPIMSELNNNLIILKNHENANK